MFFGRYQQLHTIVSENTFFFFLISSFREYIDMLLQSYFIYGKRHQHILISYMHVIQHISAAAIRECIEMLLHSYFIYGKDKELNLIFQVDSKP